MSKKHQDLYCTTCVDITPHTWNGDEYECDICGTTVLDWIDAEQKETDLMEEEEFGKMINRAW
jgi:rRNA maturation endonuclease Nob1